MSERLASIPDSYFGKTMGRIVEHGPLPLINMAVGIPDGETPKGIINHFSEALCIPENQKYGPFHGKDAFKQAIVNFYQRHYDVELDKEDEVCILYGTKNGLVALPTCVVNPGEIVLLPDPGYTDYLAGVMLADAKPLPLKLSPPNYLPNWNTISAKVLEKTKLIYLTYPNNPTGSTATQDDFDEAIHRFKGTQTKIVHDFAYSAFGFDAKNPSILASKNAKDAATYALNHYDEFLEKQNEIFRRRRDNFESQLKHAHLPFVHSKGGIYIWLHTPPGYDSEAFEQLLLKEKSILVAPGKPFGENGNQYVRVSLALDDKQLEEAANRLTQLRYLYER